MLLQLGVVQTAYANGAATKYIRDHLQIETVMAKTGVKHLHAEAVKFDAGVYFESNGHGAVVFSKRLLDYACKVGFFPLAFLWFAMFQLTFA